MATGIGDKINSLFHLAVLSIPYLDYDILEWGDITFDGFARELCMNQT